MPERNIQSETWCLGAPLSVGSISLLPVERVVIRASAGDAHLWAWASKEPYALVISDGQRTWAVSACATRLSIDELREKLPAIG